MIKRIISFTCIFIITICLFIPIVNAEEYIVIPVYDREPLYEILSSVDQGGGAEPYIIYGVDASDINLILDPVGFITHFFGSSRLAGEYYVNMYSTRTTEIRSRLKLWISNNETMVLWYEVGNFLSGNSSDYYQYRITDSMSIEDDFMIISTNDGELQQYYYNTYSEQPTNSITALSFCFIGDIYLYGQTPVDVDNAIIQDAFNRGKAQGLIEGEDIGYEQGLRDGANSVADNQAIFDSGYQLGYAEGEVKGYQDGLKADTSAAYNAGIAKGQNEAQIIPNAINGFFDAMLGFFNPFLSIGFGSLTLYSLLGIMIIVVVCTIIIKVTRG